MIGPLLVLGSLELGLRVFGYGYPTSFFLRTQINGQPYYVPNERFSCLFFPSRMARPSLPVRVAVNKPNNAFRIFLFGESAANGDPDPSYGFGRYLEVLLRGRFPGTEFQVVCVAVTAINSHAILRIARECVGLQGDLWVVYMGNNEMVGPFGAETVFGPKAPRRWWVSATLAVKSTRIGQLLNSLAEQLKPGARARKSWGGMQMFTDNALRHDDPARLRAQKNFKANLEDILRAGRRAGVPIILSTVAVNLKECAPFASMHAGGLTESDEALWRKTYEEGAALEAAGSYREALARYEKAASLDSQYADLQFRMGRCSLALTNYSQARRQFELARDYDALAFRADTAINEAIKAAAARHASEGVRVVDAAEAFARNSPAGIPGGELFYEHVHLTFEGNYLLARTLAEEAKKLLPAAVAARDKGHWAPADTCDRRPGGDGLGSAAGLAAHLQPDLVSAVHRAVGPCRLPEALREEAERGQGTDDFAEP